MKPDNNVSLINAEALKEWGKAGLLILLILALTIPFVVKFYQYF